MNLGEKKESTSTSTSNSKFGVFGSNKGDLTSVICKQVDGKLSLECGFVVGGTSEQSGKMYKQTMYIPRLDIFWGNETNVKTPAEIHKSVQNSINYCTTLVEQFYGTFFDVSKFDENAVAIVFEENWSGLQSILGESNSMFDETYDKWSLEKTYNECMEKAFVAIEYKSALLLHAIGTKYQEIVAGQDNELIKSFYDANCVKYSVRNLTTQEYEDTIGYKIGNGYLFLHYSKGGEYLNPTHPSSLLKVTEYTSKQNGNLVVGLYSNHYTAQNTIMKNKHDVKNISGNYWKTILNSDAEKDMFSKGECRKKTYENLLAIKLFETKD